MSLRTTFGTALALIALAPVGTALAAMDVKLGILEDVRASGRTGAYPNGRNGISMATTSCNMGTVNCPWYAPMSENHPGIAMAVYREKDGVFRQVGISWMKHGFFALSNSQCTPCQNPSGGEFLGVGCSDTYSAGNNADRDWLGPRSEWDPTKGTWECTGSFFSGGQNDCVRRVGDDGQWNGADHRVEVLDADLGQSGATYYYEGYYVVNGETAKMNNIGSRRCTMNWDGVKWQFQTPSSNNALLEGPALQRWGDVKTWGNVATGDGQAYLSVKTTDLGGGVWHYEYALFNFDSNRKIGTFSIPVGDVTISNVGFNDIDQSAVNDWGWTLQDGVLEWASLPFGDTNANPIVFGTLYNFRFDATTAPVDILAEITPFTPGASMDPVPFASRGPGVDPADAPDFDLASGVKLFSNRPNPLQGSTEINFQLPVEDDVRLDVYDLSGRHVKSLLSGRTSAGVHGSTWDGRNASGERVATGQYYYRLQTSATTLVRSMLLLN